VEIRRAAHSYPALVGSGLLRQIGEYVRKYLPRKTCAIISDDNVAALFGDRIKRSLESANFQPTLIAIPAGERSKTLEQAGAAAWQMLAPRTPRATDRPKRG